LPSVCVVSATTKEDIVIARATLAALIHPTDFVFIVSTTLFIKK
jgi:hypothetical protein